MRASVAYKGNWVRRTKSFARDQAGAGAVARGDAWLAELVTSIAPNTSLAAQLAALLKNLAGAELKGFMAESVIGTYPLEVVASSRAPGKDALPAGSFAVLSIELAIDGVPWLGAAPAFVGG